MQLLKDADTSLVRLIQDKLIQLGLLELPIDGKPGPNTHKAWATFKRMAHDINLDMVGAESLAALDILVTRSRKDLIIASEAALIFQRELTSQQLASLNKTLIDYEITTNNRICHFLAQIGHETGGLRWMKELSDGSQYEDRKDLGNTQKGDGPRFKGAGCLMLSGRVNYQSFSNYVKDPKVMQGCDYVAERYPFESAGWFWHCHKKLNQLCDDKAPITQITKVINGGLNGLTDRKAYYDRAVIALTSNKVNK